MNQPQPERHSNNAPHMDPRSEARRVRPLTWEEIKYFIDHDFGQFFEEDFYEDLRFDRAIEAEPEIE